MDLEINVSSQSKRVKKNAFLCMKINRQTNNVFDLRKRNFTVVWKDLSLPYFAYSAIAASDSIIHKPKMCLGYFTL